VNVWNAILWGFLATVVMTSIMAASQALRWTRMSMPLIVGTIFTEDLDRARLAGLCVHFVNGWLFALLYAATFESLGSATWWTGAFMGMIQAFFVLTVGMSTLPGLHPRMANEEHGPTPTRLLQPPGFLALNYGMTTPLAVLAAHVVYGAILGEFYVLSPG
jgi:hypothetical protein